MFKKLCIFLITLSFVSSCSSYSRKVKIKLQGAPYCQLDLYGYGTPYPSDEEIVKILADGKLQQYFSQRSIRLAMAYGFVNELKAFPDQIKSGTSEVVKLKKDLFLMKQISLIKSDINAAASILRCYIDRFSEILEQIVKNEEEIVQSNTLYAIMTGAIATIIDGLTAYDTPTNVAVIITGGVLVSYFSYLAYEPEVTVNFTPRSTILKDMWTNPESSVNFSPSMWFLIRKDPFNDPKIPPMRERLIKRWVDNGFLGPDNSAEREEMLELYFGKGGDSSRVHILHRREMLIEIKSMLQLYEQDIRGLELELDKITNETRIEKK
jgi:hypothetical protein